jgi:hypothetical protein
MPSGDSWGKKKKRQIWTPKDGKMKMSPITNEKLAHFSSFYSLPLGTIFCLSTCAASSWVSGICFSAPRTAVGWQPGRHRESHASLHAAKQIFSERILGPDTLGNTEIYVILTFRQLNFFKSSTFLD